MTEPEASRADTDKGNCGFWSTLPGVLTAIAGLITAVAGIAALFIAQRDDPPSQGHAQWIREADRLCSETTDDLRGMPTITFADPETIIYGTPEASEELRQLAERMRTLEAAAEDEDKIARLTGLIDKQANEFDNVVPVLELKGEAAARVQWSAAENLNPEIDSVAEALGVSACAQTAYTEDR